MQPDQPDTGQRPSESGSVPSSTEESVPAPAASSSEGRTPLRATALEVASHNGLDEEIELSVVAVPAGKGVMALSTSTAEQVQATFSGWLDLLVSDGRGGIEQAGQGMGVLTLSDQRVFGVLQSGRGLGARCAVDDRGNGRVVIYTIDRSLIEKHKAILGRRKKTKAVSLIGNYCALTIEVIARQGGAGRTFVPAKNDDLLSVAQRWVRV
jgi:hypothetical protein